MRHLQDQARASRAKGLYVGFTVTREERATDAAALYLLALRTSVWPYDVEAHSNQACVWSR